MPVDLVNVNKMPRVPNPIETHGHMDRCIFKAPQAKGLQRQGKHPCMFMFCPCTSVISSMTIFQIQVFLSKCSYIKTMIETGAYTAKEIRISTATSWQSNNQFNFQTFILSPIRIGTRHVMSPRLG